MFQENDARADKGNKILRKGKRSRPNVEHHILPTIRRITRYCENSSARLNFVVLNNLAGITSVVCKYHTSTFHLTRLINQTIFAIYFLSLCFFIFLMHLFI